MITYGRIYKMKKLLGIVVLGLFWCNVGFAEWKEVVTSDRGAIYIDTQTVSKIDNNFIFMQLFSYTIPIKVSGTTWYSDISKVELDCTNWPFNNFREGTNRSKTDHCGYRLR